MSQKKLDSRMRRLLRETKRNPVAEEMHKYHKPKTHKQKKQRFKDMSHDDLETWEKDADDNERP